MQLSLFAHPLHTTRRSWWWLHNCGSEEAGHHISEASLRKFLITGVKEWKRDTSLGRPFEAASIKETRILQVNLEWIVHYVTRAWACHTGSQRGWAQHSNQQCVALNS